DSRCRAQRQRTQLRRRGAGIRRLRRLPAAPSRPAANLRRRSHANGASHSTVRARRGHADFSGIGSWRADAKLGQLAGIFAAILRALVLLVDVLARATPDSRFPGLLHGRRCFTGTSEDRTAVKTQYSLLKLLPCSKSVA